MNNKKYVWLLIILVSIFFTACGPMPPATTSSKGTLEAPDIGIPTEKLNKDMKLAIPKVWNTFKTRDPISLLVRPVSQRKISIDQAAARPFLYDNGKWVELKNVDETIYVSGNSTVILDLSQEFPDGNPRVTVDLPDPNKPALLRIFVIGYVYEGEKKTDEEVASYIDVNLTP